MERSRGESSHGSVTMGLIRKARRRQRLSSRACSLSLATCLQTPSSAPTLGQSC